MNDTTTRRLAATSMIGAAALATAGFTGLGAVFDYPAILDEPTAQILDAYRAHQAAVSLWFATLVLAAAVLAPIAGLGIAAASGQVIGLSRWLVLVPRFSHDALDPGTAASAIRRFELAHTWLGHALGETLGYAL